MEACVAVPARPAAGKQRATRAVKARLPGGPRSPKVPATAKANASPGAHPRELLRADDPTARPPEMTPIVPASELPALTAPFDPRKEKTVTVKEAAYRLGKSEDVIYVWLRSGRLRGWQPGGRRCAVLVSEASVEEALVCLLGVTH